MSTSTKIVWIDDNPGRKGTAEELGARFIDVKGEDLEQRVTDLLTGPQPRLVIIDHILDKTATTNPLFQRGSTIAEAIKEQWPACPVVGVTNADKVHEIDVRTRRTYDELFSFVDLGKYLDRIDCISRGFASVINAKVRKAEDLLRLLKPPKDEIARLSAALPDDLKNSFRDKSIASRLYGWVDYLMGRPGFLYDHLWTATLLGLNESGLLKVITRFKKAKYIGVFARENDPRWWSSQLSEVLYKRCKPGSDEMSWQVGRRLPGIKKDHFSRCYSCNEEFPEIVAYLDAASDKRAAMHLKCTVLHPRHKQELYFEDIRMMQG